MDKKISYIGKITVVLGLLVGVTTQANAAGLSCRIQINTPPSDAPIIFPLHVTGVILPETDSCKDEWSHSEVSIGNMYATDANGIALTEEVDVPAVFTPPVQYPLPFTVILKLKDLAPTTTAGKIVIFDREITEADGDEQHIFETPVTYHPAKVSSYTFKKTLKFGMKSNADVKELQKLLISRGYLKGKATGNYLDGTKKAVMEYQKDHGLPQTGTCGAFTRQLLSDNE